MARTDPTRNTGSMDPGAQGSARQSPIPDADTYERPATTRITGANLGLSIVVLLLALLAALLIWLLL